MHGSVFHLKAKQNGSGFVGLWCRRPSDYTRGVKPTLSVRQCIGTLRTAWFPSDELRVAQAAVLNRCKNVPMRMMNVAGYPVTLAVGALVADFEAVDGRE